MEMMKMMQMMQGMKGGGGGKGMGGGMGKGGKGNAGGGGGGQKWNADKSKTAWVGNLPAEMTEEELKANFSTAGTVVKVGITGRKRTGIVEYSSAAEVQQAISMFNGCDVGGSQLHVDVWSK